MTLSVPTPALDALPVALRDNVLAYAARKVRELDALLKTGKMPIAAATLIDELTKTDAAVAHGVAATAEPPVVRSLTQEIKALGGELSRLVAFNTGDALTNDKALLAIVSDLTKHFKGNPPADALEAIHTQALEYVLHLQETNPAGLRALSRTAIVPAIGEVVTQVAKLTDYRKLAFAGIAGVALGVAMKDVLFPHKTPDQQTQRA